MDDDVAEHFMVARKRRRNRELVVEWRARQSSNELERIDVKHREQRNLQVEEFSAAATKYSKDSLEKLSARSEVPRILAQNHASLGSVCLNEFLCSDKVVFNLCYTLQPT